MPDSFDELSDQLELIDGVHFRQLFEHLPKRVENGDEALRIVVKMIGKQ